MVFNFNKTIKMYTSILIVAFLSILAVKEGLTQEIYENSTDICERCDCRKSENNLILDCTERGIEHALSNWPDHGDTLKAIFSKNTIKTLQKQPSTNAKTSLVFDHCGIEYINLKIFDGMTNVTLVDLSHNLITSDILSGEIFCGPYSNSAWEPLSLETLNLAYNKIHSLPKKLFEHLPHLKVLHLEGNHFRVIDVQTQTAISSIKSLQMLNLGNNNLEDLPEEVLRGLSNLKEVDLSDNNIDFIPGALVQVANSLEKLVINNNPIYELNDESFQGLKNIIYLYLNNLTHVKFVDANTFSPLENLKELELSQNAFLIYIDSEAFRPDTKLTKLYLNDNALNNLNESLIDWSSLQVWDFSSNKFECSCDLYNISTKLKRPSNSSNNGKCSDPRNLNIVEIPDLKKDICDVTTPLWRKYSNRHITRNLSMLQVSLLTLVVLLVVSSFVLVGVCYTKYKTFQRTVGHDFTSNIRYNPLSSYRL